jgi:hypothetical protein
LVLLLLFLFVILVIFLSVRVLISFVGFLRFFTFFGRRQAVSPCYAAGTAAALGPLLLLAPVLALASPLILAERHSRLSTDKSPSSIPRIANDSRIAADKISLEERVVESESPHI